MARKIITFLCMLFAVLLAGVWLAQKSGEKIIYADVRVAANLPYLTLARYRRSPHRLDGWQLVQTDVYVYVTAKDGRLFVNRIGEVRWTGKAATGLSKWLGGPGDMTIPILISEWSFPLLPAIGAFLLVPFLLILPAQMRLWRRRRRMRNKECLRCGYSLVGNESGTCPECGDAAHLAGSPAAAR